jgi:hypothetical protein
MNQLWEILVPTVRNDGRPISTRFHRVWDAKVRAISGGLTVLQPTRGQWVAPCGTLFQERMIPVRIACAREQMAAIADMTARYYEQLAVMYWKVSEEVHVRHYSSEKKYAPHAVPERR